MATIALTVALLMPVSGLAQSVADEPAGPTTEVFPTEESVADEQPPDAATVEAEPSDETNIEQDGPIAPTLPMRDLSANPRAYLSSVRTLPGTLAAYEFDATRLIRNLQLEAVTRERAITAMNRLAVASSGVAARTQRLIAPTQLAAVQDLFASATEETRMAIQITSDSLLAGESAVPSEAKGHFTQSFRLTSAALVILDGA